jgi:hypothetical protein
MYAAIVIITAKSKPSRLTANPWDGDIYAAGMKRPPGIEKESGPGLICFGTIARFSQFPKM